MSRFGKIELSDPQLEQNQLRFLTFQSPALGGRGDVSLFIPSNSEGVTNLPLVILLHGVYCSHWSWPFKGRAHLTAAEMIATGEIPPMVLAMPSDGLWAEGTGYLRHETADYEAWIVEDVIECVGEVVEQVGDSVFIAGLSMGGYGALRLGAKYPDRFHGISAHSSITCGEDLQKLINRQPLPFVINHPDELNVLYWMQKNQQSLPPFRFDCGRDDALLPNNQQLHQQLRENNIPHQYEEFPGDHKWPYWAEHLRDTLKFFGEIVRS